MSVAAHASTVPSHSNDSRGSLWDRATAQRNVVIYAAVLVAVPAAYGFHVVFSGQEAGFLLLVTLGVGVPTAYNSYWPTYDRLWKTVVWVVGAAALSAAAFAGLFVAGTDLFALSAFPASASAFVVTAVGVHGIPFVVFGRGDG